MDTKFKGQVYHTSGDLPKIGSKAPDFTLLKTDLSTVSLKDFVGKKIILNVFVSVDTKICEASVRKFNEEAANLENTEVLCISMDLPFAFQRFCGAQKIENVTTLSAFRNSEFGEHYGLLITDGPLKGLLARSVFVLDENKIIKYHELVDDIAHEPDYITAIDHARNS